MNNLQVTKQCNGFAIISTFFICVFISWASLNVGVLRNEVLTDNKSEKLKENDKNLDYSNKKELQKLASKVQRRLQYIQNPKNCSTRRKLHCLLHSNCGFGCHVNILSKCLLIAYALDRTMVSTTKHTSLLKPLSSTCVDVHGANETVFGKDHRYYQVVDFFVRIKYKPNFYPPAVPNDLYNSIRQYHDNPFLWWTGQISSYIFRLKENTLKDVMSYGNMEAFKKPIVGVHVRRTDKAKYERAFQPLDKYMKYVEAWFKSRPKLQPRIFLATDDASVLKEIQRKYPQYKVFNNANFTTTAYKKGERMTEFGQLGIIHDIYMLSKCDFLVCTFSSNVCTVSYQLMNAERGNVTGNVRSLDKKWDIWDGRKSVNGETLVVNVDMPKYPDTDEK